jgi:hypothetical protein
MATVPAWRKDQWLRERDKSKATARPRLAEIREREMDYCRDHPLYFIENYTRIEDKTKPRDMIQLFKLWPAQREAAEKILGSRLSIALKARQLGITWLAAAIATHTLLFQRGSLTVVLSRTEDEAKEIVRRVAYVILANMPEFIREDSRELTKDWDGLLYQPTALEIAVYAAGKEKVSPSRLKAFASSSSAGRSFTADLIILDEWAFQAEAEDIWSSLYPTVNRAEGAGRVIGVSTIERGTLFEELFLGDNDFTKIFLPWNADPTRDAAWYERTVRSLGKDETMKEYPATVEEAVTIPGGAYFPEFNPLTHVIKGEPEPWEARYVAMDYGLDMFAALFFAVNRAGDVRVYREIHTPGLLVSEAAAMLLEASGEEVIDAIYAPRDMWARHQETGRTVTEIFQDRGLTLTIASASRERGCQNMKEYLRLYERTDEQTGETILRAGLMIYEGAAPNLVISLSKVQKDKRKPNEYSGNPHRLTHILDAFRYFAVSRPAEPREERRPEPLLFKDLVPEDLPAERLAGYGEAVRVV